MPGSAACQKSPQNTKRTGENRIICASPSRSLRAANVSHFITLWAPLGRRVRSSPATPPVFRDLYATWLAERCFWAIFRHLLVCPRRHRGYGASREREIPGRESGLSLRVGGIPERSAQSG